MKPGMATPKSALIKLDLSGQAISFLSPVNYSKNFPWPSEKEYRINIHDKDIYKSAYTELENAYSIRQSYWDYGRGIIFGGAKGTLSMTVVLYRTFDKNTDAKNSSEFITALQTDFEKTYDKQAREEFGIELPEHYQTTAISNLDWGHYEYLMGRGERHVVYAIPVSKQHYLMVTFNFINNSHGEKNDWKDQAQATVDFIMSSFKMN